MTVIVIGKKTEMISYQLLSCSPSILKLINNSSLNKENHNLKKPGYLVLMPDSLYGARLQGFTVVVFIVAKSRAWFDEYIYHDSLQARTIEGIGH